jgi:outer membrane lipoprotein-sorting protein
MRTVAMICGLVTVTLSNAQELRNGESVLRAMHDRYQASWYQTVTFTQKSTTYKPDGTSSSETWYEAALPPGRLRIDIGTPSEGNGYVFADGKLTIVKANKVAQTIPEVNILLVLGFDVYRQDAEATIKMVKAKGYDLSKLREDTWEGHPVYVVGAENGDSKSKQFWVTKDTLLFVREIEPAREDPTKSEDIRFEDYRELAGGWIAARVEMYSEAKKVFQEEYSDIQANVKLLPSVFDAQQFSATHWEK